MENKIDYIFALQKLLALVELYLVIIHNLKIITIIISHFIL